MARTPVSLLGIAFLVMVGCAPPKSEARRHVPLKSLVKPLRARLTPADTNHNGLLETHELKRYYADYTRERFRALNSHDLRATLGATTDRQAGPVTLDQFIAARNHHLIHRLRLADRNGDHALSRHEVGPLRWERLRAADANHDGVVTFDELEHAFGRHGLRESTVESQ